MEEPAGLGDIYKSLENHLKRKYYGWEGRSQFDGTGDRLVRAFAEFCWTQDKIQKEVDKALKAEFDYDADEMLVEGPIDIWTLCPHHLIPCHFEVYVGYIPQGLVLGLSKFARIADALSRRPIIQEMYVKELADTIEKGLKPIGAGVHVIGQHGCMQARGIRQRANVTNSALRGAIKDRPEARAEFYALVRERNGK